MMAGFSRKTAVAPRLRCDGGISQDKSVVCAHALSGIMFGKLNLREVRNS